MTVREAFKPNDYTNIESHLAQPDIFCHALANSGPVETLVVQVHAPDTGNHDGINVRVKHLVGDKIYGFIVAYGAKLEKPFQTRQQVVFRIEYVWNVTFHWNVQ